MADMGYDGSKQAEVISRCASPLYSKGMSGRKRSIRYNFCNWPLCWLKSTLITVNLRPRQVVQVLQHN